jgi:hypothetical protein
VYGRLILRKISALVHCTVMNTVQDIINSNPSVTCSGWNLNPRAIEGLNFFKTLGVTGRTIIIFCTIYVQYLFIFCSLNERT